MHFFGLKESALMGNSGRGSKNQSPAPAPTLQVSPIVTPNTIVSQMIQLSRLDMSHPWDLQTHTDIAESIDDMSNFSQSHLVESVMTRETKIIASHKQPSMMDSVQDAPKEPVPTDPHRRFSRNTVPQQMNDLIFSKKPDEKNQETRAKLMNDKLNLKYQRMFKKRFSNFDSPKSSSLSGQRLVRQVLTRAGKRRPIASDNERLVPCEAGLGQVGPTQTRFDRVFVHGSRQRACASHPGNTRRGLPQQGLRARKIFHAPGNRFGPAETLGVPLSARAGATEEIREELVVQCAPVVPERSVLQRVRYAHQVRRVRPVAGAGKGGHGVAGTDVVHAPQLPVDDPLLAPNQTPPE